MILELRSCSEEQERQLGQAAETLQEHLKEESQSKPGIEMDPTSWKVYLKC